MPARTRSRSTRVLGALVAAVASAAVLAACGSDDSTATSTPTATTTSASATGSASASATAGETPTGDATTGATSAEEPDAPVTTPGEAATAPPQEAQPAVDDRGEAFLSSLREAGVEPYDQATAISIADYVCSAQAQGGSPDDVKTMVTALVGSSAVASGAEITEEEAASAADTYISVAGASYCSQS